MKPGHFHVAVRDLDGAIRAFRELWALSPGFENERMATFRFGEIGLLLDRSDDETSITLAFVSDCDADCERAAARGSSTTAPRDQAVGCAHGLPERSGPDHVRNRRVGVNRVERRDFPL